VEQLNSPLAALHFGYYVPNTTTKPATPGASQHYEKPSPVIFASKPDVYIVQINKLVQTTCCVRNAYPLYRCKCQVCSLCKPMPTDVAPSKHINRCHAFLFHVSAHCVSPNKIYFQMANAMSIYPRTIMVS
jgi:hypothetical protein